MLYLVFLVFVVSLTLVVNYAVEMIVVDAKCRVFSI